MNEARFRPEQRKNTFELLQELLLRMSQRMNEELSSGHGLNDLLNADCTINMESFAKSKGGIYSDEKITEDQELDYNNEVRSAVAYREDNKSPQQRRIVERWREEKSKSRAAQVEIVVTALFYKVLKEEFVVLRTAEHDDFGGVDNIIINKNTGDILCAIDDVHEGDHDRGKAEKTKKIAEKGGAKLEYGVKVENKKIKRAPIKNVPVFYLGMTTEQLSQLLAHMSFDPDASLAESEQQMFSSFVSSLEQQQKQLAGLNLKQPVKDNLNKFEACLLRMKAVAESKSNQSKLDSPIAA